MKRKFNGLITIGMVAAALIAFAVYAVHISKKTTLRARQARVKEIPKISIPNPGTLKEIERVEKQMDRLPHPTAAADEQVNLALFGYYPMKRTTARAIIRRPDLPVRFDHSLTFSFSSATKKFCIIDDVFYSEGSLLPDGGTVLQIEPGRVLIKKQQFQHWISIKDHITGPKAEMTEKEKPTI